ncbi:MAG TPA: sulfotransferase, partial [Allocoleopsis sp.]
EFLNSMLDVSNSQEAKNISVLSALWQTNSCPPIPAYIDKFKKSMSMDEIEIIETIAGDYMDYYGYEKMTPAKAKITQEMSEGIKVRSEEKKQRAWVELRENAPQDYQLRKFRATYLNMLKERLLQDQPLVLKKIKNVHQMA